MDVKNDPPDSAPPSPRVPAKTLGAVALRGKIQPTEGPYRPEWRELSNGEPCWDILGPEGQYLAGEGVDSRGAPEAFLLAASWEMRKVLEGLEWSVPTLIRSGSSDYGTCCPACGAMELPGFGHSPSCPLALALAHARGERLEEHAS